MDVSLKEAPDSPVIFESSKLSWIEFRNELGRLITLVVFMPGGEAFLVSSIEDPDFVTTAHNFNIKLQTEPGQKILLYENALLPPYISTSATWLEFRDNTGCLSVVFIFVPGKEPQIYDRNDSHFSGLISGFNL